MIVETGIGNLLEDQITRETGTVQRTQGQSEILGAASIILEFLIFVNDLDPVLVLLLRSILSNICEMTVERHDGRRRRMSGILRRAALSLIAERGCCCRHDGGAQWMPLCNTQHGNLKCCTKRIPHQA